jgi:hypothetical protein
LGFVKRKNLPNEQIFWLTRRVFGATLLGW